MKILLPLFILFFYSPVGNSQIKFDGFEDATINISDQESKTILLDSINVLIFKIDTFDTRCGKILISRSGQNVKITFCDTSIHSPFTGNQIKINTIREKSITVLKTDSRTVLNNIVSGNKILVERIIFQDAKTLTQGSDAEKQFVLDVWGINPSTENNFLKGKIKSSDNAVLFSSGTTNLAEDKPSGILGFNATIIADGFAKFLVSRVKKEMAIQFFKGVKDKINDPKLRDIQELFYNSYLTLQNLDEEIYNYQVYLPTIKQSFETDLSVLPNTLSVLLRNNHSQLSIHLDNRNQELRPVLSTFLDFGNALKNQIHLGVAIANLKENPNLPKANPKFKSGIKTLVLISEALRDTFTGRDKPYWIDQIAFNELISDPDFFNCFMGLTLEKAKKEKIQLGTGELLWKKMNSLHNQINDLQFLFSQAHLATQEINNLVNSNLQSIGEKKRDLIYYFDLGNKMIQLLRPIDEVFDINNDKYDLDTLLLVSQSLQDFVKGFTSRQFSYGLLSLTRLIEILDQNGKMDGFLKVLRKEAMFIAQIGEANTSNEVAAVIENFAAPVGSWRDKRYAKWNVAFDSYVGVGGYWPSNIDNVGSKFGVPTPIGFSITTPANFISFMGSLVDIGPMVAFRFLDQENDVPNTYLKEIFAPGAFVSFNLDQITGKDFLLKLNTGYQQFPLLEETTGTLNKVSLTQKAGWTASVNVNIPILTLYNKN